MGGVQYGVTVMLEILRVGGPLFFERAGAQRKLVSVTMPDVTRSSEAF